MEEEVWGSSRFFLEDPQETQEGPAPAGSQFVYRPGQQAELVALWVGEDKPTDIPPLTTSTRRAFKFRRRWSSSGVLSPSCGGSDVAGS